MNLKRAVVLVGGWAHPGHDQAIALRALLEPRGFLTTVVTDPEMIVQEVAAGCDLLVVGACWFAMDDARYNDEQRLEHSVVLDDDAQTALSELQKQGCPLFALHTAVLCFDDWKLWRDWLGGTWNWETSSHPEPAEFVVARAADAPTSFDGFKIFDELYQGLDLDGDTVTVAESENGDPLAWLHETASGRAVVNVLGHDQTSLMNPDHEQLNNQLLDWLLQN